jgi:hypothetical protein
MRRIAPVIAFVAALIAPAFAQKADIEAVNARAIFSKVSRCSGDALRAIRSHSSAYLR